jgi:hypothetical protein
MDDTSIQYRLRLAQINGIKLKESAYDDRRANRKEQRAPVLGTYHDSMAKHLRNGVDDIEAHQRAKERVVEKHGESALDHIDHHAWIIGGESDMY